MNKKVIIAIVIVIIVAILGVLFLVGSANVTLIAGDTSLTLPNDYVVDEKGIAYNGDIGIMYSPVMGGNASDQDTLFKALKSNGKDAGYKNVTTDNVNGFKLYEYTANPDKLKKVSTDKVQSGDYETWKEYDPYIPYKDVTSMDVVKFRYIAYLNNDKNSLSELYIFTNNTDVDLYSKDMDSIINSIAFVEG